MNLGNSLKTLYTLDELYNLKLDFTHDEIIQILNSSVEDFVKIFSIINLDKFKNIDEAEILFYHLTNHSTPIREAVALKIEEIYSDGYFSKYIKEQFLKSIIDINPNVCRSICSVISRSDFLQNELLSDLILKIEELLFQIIKEDKELGGFFDNALKIRKNHAKNKKLFSLYWYLEALSICKCVKNNSRVLEILKTTIKFNDYTIREKTAKILSIFDNIPSEMLQLIALEQNFYVKNQVYDKIKVED